jgi:hypothetical protein
MQATMCTRVRSLPTVVPEIEHSSISRAHFACDRTALRVKSELKFGCSIGLINKRRSITELNPDSRPSRFIVELNRRLASRTIRFCGLVPPSGSQRLRSTKSYVAGKNSAQISLANAGFAPAFAFARAPRSTAAPLTACTRRPTWLRGTVFISVSGHCPERSALHSDLRLKRSSGSAAAPELPHAPMNGPAASRAGFPS